MMKVKWNKRIALALAATLVVTAAPIWSFDAAAEEKEKTRTEVKPIISYTPVKATDAQGEYVNIKDKDCIMGVITTKNDLKEIDVADKLIDGTDVGYEESDTPVRFLNIQIKDTGDVIPKTGGERTKVLVWGDGAETLIDSTGNAIPKGNITEVETFKICPRSEVELKVSSTVDYECDFEWMFFEKHTCSYMTNDYTVYYDYYLVRDTENLLAEKEDDRYTLNGKNLKISNATNEGIYICIKKDKTGRYIGIDTAYNVIRESHINIKTKSPVEVQAAVGDDIKLEVELESPYKDELIINWTLNGEWAGKFSSDPFYDITDIQKEFFGTYTATITDGIETYTVDFVVKNKDGSEPTPTPTPEPTEPSEPKPTPTPTPKPKTPVVNNVSAIKASGATSRSATISWSPVKNNVGAAVKYYVWKYNPAKKAWVKLGATSSTSKAITGLAPGSTTIVGVRPYIAYNGKVVWAKKMTTRKIYTYPDDMKRVDIVKRTKNSLSYKWNKVAGAKAYAIYYQNPANGKYKLVKVTTGNTFVLKGLKSRTYQTVMIRPYTKLAGKNVYSKNKFVIAYPTM